MNEYACPYCTGPVADLAYSQHVAHLYCTSCRAHGYARTPAEPLRWRTRQEWSAWIEAGPMGANEDTDGAA